VVLFKATHGNGAADDAPFSEQFSDRALGWGKRVAEDVRVIDIPGGHSSALQSPHVEVLARALQDCLAAAVQVAPSVATPPPPLAANDSAPVRGADELVAG
jgi:thioesterase domain-containing protein